MVRLTSFIHGHTFLSHLRIFLFILNHTLFDFISVCFGHNAPTTNARKPIKGSKDADFHLVCLEEQKIN